MDSSEIRRQIIEFLTDKKYNDFHQAKKYLIPLRSTIMNDCTLIESRSLWFSLLLYRFRSEHDISDELWYAARAFILESIRVDFEMSHWLASARRYLAVFEIWKAEDRRSFINEVVGYYLEVLHLKQTIEETREEETIAEWQDSYQRLLYRIRDVAQKMGFLDALDERVAEVNRIRHSLVEDMMKRAYWDMVEQDIREDKYDGAICQLLELKGLIKDIIPSRFHPELHDKFDVDFIRENLERKTLNSSHLVQLCRWVMDTMKEWDSASTRPLYDREIQTWEQAIGTMEWPRFLRFSLELCTLLALDAKTRVSIWRSVLRNPPK